MATRAELIEAGYINARRHPTEPLTIYDYGKRTQFERLWNEHTSACRGLIEDDDGNVVARPYRKFFNVGEEGTALPSNFRVFDKLDGSLGVLYREPNSGLLSIATRGSFESHQSAHATKLLRERYGDFKPPTGFTFLFEIIFPDNKVILDYGTMDEIILHGVLDNKTGADRHDLMSVWPGPKVESFAFTSLENLPLDRKNAEGFVLVEWPAPKDREATKLKIKQLDYDRLHKLLAGLTPHRVWECLAAGDPLISILDGVPDEQYKECVKISNDYNEKHAAFKREATAILTQIKAEAAADAKKTVPLLWGRKQHAERIQKEAIELRPLIFKLMDNKSIDSLIWKQMEPRGDLKLNITPNLDG